MEEGIKSDIDINGPIDFDDFKKRIYKNGPLRVRQQDNPYALIINVNKCGCDWEECKEDVITVERQTGMSSIFWSISPEILCGFDSINEFYMYCQYFGINSSSYERQMIEQWIHGALGKPYHEIEDPVCLCDSCIKAITKGELWKRYALTSLANQLNLRGELVDLDDENFKENEEIFEAGYALGRMVGEYFMKMGVEELAEKGLAAERSIQARTAASGQKSSAKRHLRISEMMNHMESLLADNPDFARLGADAIGEIAILDASKANPKLWSQGKGKMREYLDEMRADIRYRDRFLRMRFGA